MRRILLFLLLTTSSLLSAVSLVQTGGAELSPAVLERMERAINRSGEGIIPSEIEEVFITDASETQNALSVTVEGYNLIFDKSRLMASIDEEIEAFLVYPPFLAPVAGDRLDYIYASSYSTHSLDGAGKGDVYDLLLPSGEKSARFIVSGVEEGLYLLSPLYIKSAHAGLALEKRGSWALDLSLLQIFTPAWGAGGSIRVKNTSWLYPFNPSFGLEAGMADRGSWYLVGLAGVEYSMQLGGLIDSSFTLVQDAGLYGGVDLALGYGGAGAIWGASWRAGYSHHISRSFSWSAGLEYTILQSMDDGVKVLRQYRLSLGLGVVI